MRRARILAILLLAAGAALGGCAANPATGRSSFTAFMSPEEELKVGRDEHPKILRQFGGEYPDPKIRAYVQELGKRLAARSEMPELDWHFTVLNSDVINAFALPGGYVYVTRALLALASSEAELAGVIGHEIGHVTARHAAQRYSRGTAAAIGATGLGVLVGVLTGSGALAQGASQLAGAGAQTWLAGYSREQEFQADELGVRYLARDGYDVYAMARFLEKLGEDSRLSAEMMGRPEAADEFSILQTHPRTPERVRAAIEEAGEAARRPDAIVNREPYLRTIEGLAWGGDVEDGFIKNRVFVHPRLRLKFEVPEGFRLTDSAAAVVARGPDGALIAFMANARAPAGDAAALAAFLRQRDFRGVETLTVDQLPAATGVSSGQTRSGVRVDQRVVLIRGADRVWQFVFQTSSDTTARFEPLFLRTTRSFDQLTAAQAAAEKPLRIRLARVGAGDTPETMARRMATADPALRRFEVLNGVKPGDRLEPGQLVKLIAE